MASAAKCQTFCWLHNSVQWFVRQGLVWFPLNQQRLTLSGYRFSFVDKSITAFTGLFVLYLRYHLVWFQNDMSAAGLSSVFLRRTFWILTQVFRWNVSCVQFTQKKSINFSAKQFFEGLKTQKKGKLKNTHCKTGGAADAEGQKKKPYLGWSAEQLRAEQWCWKRVLQRGAYEA